MKSVTSKDGRSNEAWDIYVENRIWNRLECITYEMKDRIVSPRKAILCKIGLVACYDMKE